MITSQPVERIITWLKTLRPQMNMNKGSSSSSHSYEGFLLQLHVFEEYVTSWRESSSSLIALFGELPPTALPFIHLHHPSLGGSFISLSPQAADACSVPWCHVTAAPSRPIANCMCYSVLGFSLCGCFRTCNRSCGELELSERVPPNHHSPRSIFDDLEEEEELEIPLPT